MKKLGLAIALIATLLLLGAPFDSPAKDDAAAKNATPAATPETKGADATPAPKDAAKDATKDVAVPEKPYRVAIKIINVGQGEIFIEYGQDPARERYFLNYSAFPTQGEKEKSSVLTDGKTIYTLDPDAKTGVKMPYTAEDFYDALPSDPPEAPTWETMQKDFAELGLTPKGQDTVNDVKTTKYYLEEKEEGIGAYFHVCDKKLVRRIEYFDLAKNEKITTIEYLAIDMDPKFAAADFAPPAGFQIKDAPPEEPTPPPTPPQPKKPCHLKLEIMSGEEGKSSMDFKLDPPNHRLFMDLTEENRKGEKSRSIVISDGKTIFILDPKAKTGVKKPFSEDDLFDALPQDPPDVPDWQAMLGEELDGATPLAKGEEKVNGVKTTKYAVEETDETIYFYVDEQKLVRRIEAFDKKTNKIVGGFDFTLIDLAPKFSNKDFTPPAGYDIKDAPKPPEIKPEPAPADTTKPADATKPPDAAKPVEPETKPAPADATKPAEPEKKTEGEKK